METAASHDGYSSVHWEFMQEWPCFSHLRAKEKENPVDIRLSVMEALCRRRVASNKVCFVAAWEEL